MIKKYHYTITVKYPENFFDKPGVPLVQEHLFTSTKQRTKQDIIDGPYYKHAEILDVVLL